MQLSQTDLVDQFNVRICLCLLEIAVGLEGVRSLCWLKSLLTGRGQGTLREWFGIVDN